MFRISNLPLGRYTVEAWPEKFGVKTLEVTAARARHLRVRRQ